MTQDEIMEMAREASTEDETTRSDKKITLYAAKTKNFLERFAKLVAAKEREACAKVVEDSLWFTRLVVAKAIRARGEQA